MEFDIDWGYGWMAFYEGNLICDCGFDNIEDLHAHIDAFTPAEIKGIKEGYCHCHSPYEDDEE